MRCRAARSPSQVVGSSARTQEGLPAQARMRSVAASRYAIVSAAMVLATTLLLLPPARMLAIVFVTVAVASLLIASVVSRSATRDSVLRVATGGATSTATVTS